MPTRKTVTAVLAAAVTLIVVPPSAMASPAGSEYLPKVPQSGSHSSASGSSETPAPSSSETTSTTSSGEAAGPKTKKAAKPQKKEPKADRAPATASPVKTDGGSSGSLLLSPVTLLIAVAILAMIFWVVRRRMKARAGASPAKPRPRRGEFTGPDNAP
jgi:hypothetical protein